MNSIVLKSWLPVLLFASISSRTLGQYEIQFRINRIGDHYANLFNSTLEQERFRKAVNNHLFKYYSEFSQKPSGAYQLYPNESSYYRRDYYTFYFGGMALKKKYEGNYALRLRADKFYMERNTDISHSDTILKKYTQYLTSAKLSSFQIAPGITREITWKFLELSGGFEIPIYFRSDEKSVSTVVYTNDSTFNINKTVGVYFMPGGWFAGISLLSTVKANITDKIGAGIEYSAGVVYLQQASEKSFYSAFVGVITNKEKALYKGACGKQEIIISAKTAN